VDELTYSKEEGRTSIVKKSKQSNEHALAENLIKLERLTNPPPHSRDVINNIFFEEKDTQVNEKEDLKAESKIDIPEKIVSPVEEQRRKIEQDLSRFKSFGYQESDGEILLFLEIGNRILIIRKGDIIDGKYIVKDITKEELTLTAKSINEDVHIDLGPLK